MADGIKLTLTPFGEGNAEVNATETAVSQAMAEADAAV